MVFHWSLSDSKSPQVSRTRLSILAVLSNAVVWIVSTRPPISKSSRPFNNPLVTVPKAPITIGKNRFFHVPQLFYSLAKSRYLSFFSFSFRFILWSAGTAPRKSRMTSYVRIRDVVLKTYLGRWTIGRSGERGSGISVLPARYDDDDDDYEVWSSGRD